MRTKVEGRLCINIVYIVVIVTILFSNFFASAMSEFLYLKPNYEFNNDTEIHFINVGQGDAIAIRFDNNETMLIDSGIELYREKLIYYLDNIILEGNDTIDYLILTHIDSDHSSNIKYILERYNIGVFYRPHILSSYEDANTNNSSNLFDEIIRTASLKNISMKYNESGISLKIGNTTLRWLSPIDINSKEDITSNNHSPVIRVDYNNHSALLTGDISSEVEVELMNLYPQNLLDVDILKLAHHGSSSSTSEEFLEATSPEFACVSVGKNTYGHPADATLHRIMDYDNRNNSSLYSNLYSTKDDGNVVFTLSGRIIINTISNIDDYSFASYFTYSSIAILFLLILMLKPYYFALKKDIRFIYQNKKFKQQLEKDLDNQPSRK